MNDELREKAKAFGEKHRQQGTDGWQLMADFAESLLPKWTYCEDMLPNEDGLYLVSLDSESVLIDRWSTMEGNWWQFSNSRVTAWQPLPAPAEPKEAK